jgi:hypothetical protein
VQGRFPVSDKSVDSFDNFRYRSCSRPAVGRHPIPNQMEDDTVLRLNPEVVIVDYISGSPLVL